MSELSIHYDYQSDGSIVLTSGDPRLDGDPFLVHIKKGTVTWRTLSSHLDRDLNAAGRVEDFKNPELPETIEYSPASTNITDGPLLDDYDPRTMIRIGRGENHEDIVLDLRKPLRASKPAVTVISGQAGTGKTELLKNVVAHAVNNSKNANIRLHIIDGRGGRDYQNFIGDQTSSTYKDGYEHIEMANGMIVDVASTARDAVYLLSAVAVSARGLNGDDNGRKAMHYVIMDDLYPLLDGHHSDESKKGSMVLKTIMGVKLMGDVAPLKNVLIFMADQTPDSSDPLVGTLLRNSYYRIVCGHAYNHDSSAGLTLGEAPLYDVPSIPGRAIIKEPGERQKMMQVGLQNSKIARDAGWFAVTLAE